MELVAGDRGVGYLEGHVVLPVADADSPMTRCERTPEPAVPRAVGRAHVEAVAPAHEPDRDERAKAPVGTSRGDAHLVSVLDPVQLLRRPGLLGSVSHGSSPAAS